MQIGAITKKPMEIKKLNKDNVFYPASLKDYEYFSDISYIGELKESNSNSVAILGTRDCTRYGRKVARALVNYLSRNGICIISGLGYGIDECVQRTCLSVNCRAIGVLGCGFNYLFKAKKEIGVSLARKILNAKDTVVISPFQKDEAPSYENYILRNLFIASFAKVVVIVEAGISSKTASAVNSALNFGKTVFSIPGSIFSEKSSGTHQLIKEGAYLLDDFKDINRAVEQ